MIELYLDTVDFEQIDRFNSCLPLRGVTTNPSILAKSGLGLSQILPKISEIIGCDTRFHIQVVSQTVDAMVEEAQRINQLPYDIVVKVPATETGLAAIKKIKEQNILVLATAIYSAQQGILAALCGADYIAPYINRMDTMGNNGIAVVADLQTVLTQQGLGCKVLPASFKNTQQVLEVMKLGVAAITLPGDVTEFLINHPAVQPAVEVFNNDWQKVFGTKLSFES